MRDGAMIMGRGNGVKGARGRLIALVRGLIVLREFEEAGNLETAEKVLDGLIDLGVGLRG